MDTVDWLKFVKIKLLGLAAATKSVLQMLLNKYLTVLQPSKKHPKLLLSLLQAIKYI